LDPGATLLGAFTGVTIALSRGAIWAPGPLAELGPAITYEMNPMQQTKARKTVSFMILIFFRAITAQDRLQNQAFSEQVFCG
jgi:hypothetical protein